MDIKAIVYYNRACTYILMNNNKSALKAAEKTISILKKYKLKDDQMYHNCRRIITDMKGNPKTRNAKMAFLKKEMQDYFAKTDE